MEGEKPSVEAGLKDGETRATFILKKDLLEKIKSFSYWERLSMKDAVDKAFNVFFAVHENQNGKVKTRED